MAQWSSRKPIFAQLLLIGLSLLGAFAFWSIWQAWLETPLQLLSLFTHQTRQTLILFLSVGIMLSGVSLIALLSLMQRTAFLNLLLVAFAPAWLYRQQPWVGLSFLVLALSFFFFAWQVRREALNQVRFSIWRVFKPHLSLLITVVSLLMGIQFFAASQAQARQFEFKIPDSIFQQAAKLVQPMLEEQINRQVQGAKSYTGQYLAQLPLFRQVPPQYREALMQGEVPPDLESRLRQEGVSPSEIENFRKQLEQLTQEGLNVIQPQADEFGQLFLAQIKDELEGQINRLLAPYRQYLPALLSILVFLGVRSLGSLVLFGSVLITYLVVELLLFTNLAIKRDELVTAKRLVLNLSK